MKILTAPLSRRALLAGAAATAVLARLDGASRALAAIDPWSQAAAIVARLGNVVSFPGRDFPVTDYGAQSCQLVQTFLYAGATAALTAGATTAPGSFDCYPAFAAAIAACHAAGGGRVVVPAGNWYCAGPVVLLSNVNFHLSAGAQIWFSPNPADYAKYGPYDFGANGKLVQSRWQADDLYNFSPPVYAYGQTNIALTGEDWTSILNGQAGTPYDGTNCWWTMKGAAAQDGYVSGQPSENTPNPANLPLNVVNLSLPTALVNLIEYGSTAGGSGSTYTRDSSYLPAQSEANIPLSQRVYGLGHNLPPAMVEFFNCTNVLMQGYQVTNTPFWQHHPIACRNLVIRNVYANSTGPNNDGFDPEACSYVLCDSVTFNTGDDCIAIKSGKDNDVEYGPSQAIVIQNCTMNSGHGGVTLGSEMSAGIQNVFAQNLTMLNANWNTTNPGPLNIAIRLKTNMNRGGFLKNFYVRNISLPNGINRVPSFYTPLPGSPIAKGTVSTNQGGVVTFDCDYSPASDNVRVRPPTVSNVSIDNVQVSNVPTAGPGAAPAGTSCYQAIIVQGPVAQDFNGAPLFPTPAVTPVQTVTISNSDFGTPANAANPIYLYNIQGLVLSNVTIAGTLYNTTLSA